LKDVAQQPAEQQLVPEGDGNAAADPSWRTMKPTRARLQRLQRRTSAALQHIDSTSKSSGAIGLAVGVSRRGIGGCLLAMRCATKSPGTPSILCNNVRPASRLRIPMLPLPLPLLYTCRAVR